MDSVLCVPLDDFSFQGVVLFIDCNIFNSHFNIFHLHFGYFLLLYLLCSFEVAQPGYDDTSCYFSESEK